MDRFRRAYQPKMSEKKILLRMRNTVKSFVELTLFACVTNASRNYPLNGRNTMAIYLTG